jgi:hypothetical protein
MRLLRSHQPKTQLFCENSKLLQNFTDANFKALWTSLAMAERVP